jgi:hypothetical protein
MRLRFHAFYSCTVVFLALVFFELVAGCSTGVTPRERDAGDDREITIEQKDGASAGGPEHSRDALVTADSDSFDDASKEASNDASSDSDGGCVYSGPPVIDLTELDTCSSCANAHCLSKDLVDSEYRDQLADCEDSKSKCVPDRYLETGGKFLLKSCVSLEGVEGRCLSLCLPSVAELKDVLPIDVCGTDERCSPCYSLVTGEDTGSCSISCDSGPTSEPYTFDECCDGVSVCITDDLVSAADQPAFSQDTCGEDTMLCVPKEMASSPSYYVPESCKSWDDAEGRCLPSCLPAVAEKSQWLTQDICPDGYLCEPCYDQITGDDTGVCNIAGDPGPKNDPYTFPECCNGISVCVPADSVTENDRSQLTQDSCDSEDDLCVPKGMASNPTTYVADSCTSLGGAEGRCLPACLPDVAEDAQWLPQADCPPGYLCAPCFDPITGDKTSACTIGGDPGPQEEPYRFPECCGGLSYCIPKAAISKDDQSHFASDGCTGTDVLCVPKEIASAPETYTAKTCESWGGAEGRCLPECLPDVAEVADRLERHGCGEGYLCVPCTDQVTGETTSACSIGGDLGPTTEPAVVFDSCCDGISVCVPKDAVQVKDQPNFNSDGCQGTDLCVPVDIATKTYTPTHCLSWNNAEARCLPSCLPKVAANAARIAKGTCADDDYLCTPCFDHVTRENTSACNIGNDQPEYDPPTYIFPECCGDVSVCTPKEAIADDMEGNFEQGSCSDSNELCVPKNIALDPTGYGASQPHCQSWGGGEGRCLSTCLPAVAAVADTLKQDGDDYEDGCDEGSLCVPCYDPVTGEMNEDVCNAPGDTLPQTAYRFPRCCLQSGNPRGTCIPIALISQDDQNSLSQDNASDSCSDVGPIQEDFLCVPSEFAANSDPVASDCTSTLGGAGLCMADCFSTLPSGWLQGTCENKATNNNDDCLPCSGGAPCTQ